MHTKWVRTDGLEALIRLGLGNLPDDLWQRVFDLWYGLEECVSIESIHPSILELCPDVYVCGPSTETTIHLPFAITLRRLPASCVQHTQVNRPRKRPFKQVASSKRVYLPHTPDFITLLGCRAGLVANNIECGMVLHVQPDTPGTLFSPFHAEVGLNNAAFFTRPLVDRIAFKEVKFVGGGYPHPSGALGLLTRSIAVAEAVYIDVIESEPRGGDE
jgi:hypothetical protein